ncbi:hypothetical protein [Albibacterium profundi]|uniref:Uncharacterized protein n=1 Tax=Albibacterium profundi TaxID=3134906 RepID=A0ABV5CDU1_9SPHI
MEDLASKTGLGRICAAGVVFDGLQTIVAFSDGEITGDDWLSLAGTLAGGLAFVPGPWGVVGAGISVGIAIIKAKN